MSGDYSLLVVRHAIAQDRAEAARMGVKDAERRLTDKGRRRMERAVLGLRQLVAEPGLIACSPYTRAVQTADLLASRFPRAEREWLPALRPGGDPEAVLAWLRSQPRGTVVAVVGHEPDLGGLISYALSGQARSFITMKKGGACLLYFPGRVRAGQAQLDWSLPPKALRRMGAQQ